MSNYLVREDKTSPNWDGVNFNASRVLLAAGSANPGTAPLKFTSGAVLSTPENGTIEYLSNRFRIRGSDGLTFNSTLADSSPIVINSTNSSPSLNIINNGTAASATIDMSGVTGYNAIANANNIVESAIGLNFGNFCVFAGIGNPLTVYSGLAMYGVGGFFAGIVGKSLHGVRVKTVETIDADITASEYISTFYAADDADINAFGGGYVQNQFLYYAEKPTRGTDKYQFYGAGTGTGTGLFLGGELDWAELILSTGVDGDGNPLYYDSDFGGAGNWTGANWAVTGGVLQHTAGATTSATLPNARLTSGSIKNGKKYTIEFRLQSRTAGTLTPKLGTATGIVVGDCNTAGNTYPAALTYTNETGNYFAHITANADNADLIFTPSSDFDGAIDDVSVKVLKGWNHSRTYNSAASKLNIDIDISGTATEVVEWGGVGSETVFNDTGANIDYRFEGDTDANLLVTDASADKVGVGTATPTMKFSVSEAGGITPEGGYCVKLTAGEQLYKGEVVYMNQAGTDLKVTKNPIDGDMPLGVVYADAANDAAVWIVTSGIAEVLPEAGVTATRGYVIYSSDATAGRVDQAATVPAALTHWREVGHFIATGSGNGALTKAIIHFN